MRTKRHGAEPATRPESFRIGDLVVSVGRQQVLRGDDEIHLPRLSFLMLETLARHAPNVVELDRLVDEVWEGVTISDGTVSQRIKLVRQALGDDSDRPRYVASVRGRGYRLIAPVDRLPESGDLDMSPVARETVSASAIRGRRWLAWVGAAAALLALVPLALRPDREGTPPGTPIAAIGETLKTSELAFDHLEKGVSAYRRYRRDENERAIAFFRRALAVDPDFALARAWLANAYAQKVQRFDAGEEWADQALAEATKALRAEPNLPEAHKAIGVAHSSRRRWHAAQAAFELALQLQPAYEPARHNLAMVQVHLGRYDRAFEQLARVRFGDSIETPLALARLLYRLGLEDEAEPFVAHVLDVEPLHPKIQELYACHDLRGGDVAAARDRLERSLNLDPRRVDSLLWAGRVALVAGRPEEAASHARRIHDISEANLDASLLLAGVLKIQGRRQQAEELLRSVERRDLAGLEAGVEDPEPRWRLAAVAAWRGATGLALERYRSAAAAGHRRTWWDRLEPAFADLLAEPELRRVLGGIETELEAMRRRVIDEGWYAAALAQVAERHRETGRST